MFNVLEVPEVLEVRGIEGVVPQDGRERRGAQLGRPHLEHLEHLEHVEHLCPSGTIPALGGRNLEPGYDMNRLFAALGAGWGAKKLGGGCFTTVLIFFLLYWLLRNI